MFGLIVVLLFVFCPAEALSNTIPPRPIVAKIARVNTIFFLMQVAPSERWFTNKAPANLVSEVFGVNILNGARATSVGFLKLF